MTIASEFELFTDELDGFLDRLTEPPRTLRVVYEAFRPHGMRVLPWGVRDADGKLFCRSASYEGAWSWAREFARRLPGSSVDTSVEL